MTRTLFIDHTAEPGGAELALARYVEHDSVLGAGAKGAAGVLFLQDGPVAQRLRRSGVDVLVNDRGRSGARAAIADAIARVQPDVTVSNSLRAGVLSSTVSGPPHIHYLRDRVGPGELSRAKRTLVRQVLARRVDAVIANSASTLATLAPFLRDQPTAAVPSPSGVRAVAAGRDGVLRNGPALRVLSLSRLAPWKGQHVIVAALGRLREAAPDAAIRLTVAGAPLFGEAQYAAQLREQCAELGIAATFTGHVEDVSGLLHCHDVLVHSSTRPEPFGQVVVQGLAAGLCVVATDGGGPAEIIVDGASGLLVPPDDPAALARALERIRDSAELRAGLSAHGTAAAARYTDVECIAALRTAIDSLADQLRTARRLPHGA